MLVLRLIGALFVVAALAAVGREALAWHRTGDWTVISAGQLWFDLHKTSLQLAEPALVRHVWPPLWDPGLITLLQWPAWGVLGVLGLLLLLIAQVVRRRRRIFPRNSLSRRK